MQNEVEEQSDLDQWEETTNYLTIISRDQKPLGRKKKKIFCEKLVLMDSIYLNNILKQNKIPSQIFRHNRYSFKIQDKIII